ncbi:MAG: EAL domain-containing protein [Gammaproteobacteria bacterium]|nr:EAL domain-containing protein [Gammaproteobacteria bacterium]
MPTQQDDSTNKIIDTTNYQLLMKQLISIPVTHCFSMMAEHLAKMLNVRFVIISECYDMSSDVVKSLAFWNTDRIVQNIEYDIKGTPCELMFSGQDYYHADDAQSIFPADPFFIQHNITSYMAVPIRSTNGEIIGFIAVMDSETIDNNISTLRTILLSYAARTGVEIERCRTQNSIDALTRGYRLPIGDDFFPQLAKIIGDIFDVDYALIGRLSVNQQMIKSHAVYHRGEFLEPIEYPVANTPCETVIKQQSRSYPTDVQTLFPEFKLLQYTNASGYIATPLFDSNNNPLGLIIIVNKKPIHQASRILPILEAFAQRASYEIERQKNKDFVKYYHEILSSSDDLMAFIDTNYRYQALNRAYCQKFNKTMEQILYHTVAELHGDKVFYGGLKKSLDASLLDGKSSVTEFTRSGPNGKPLWIQGKHNPAFDADGNIIGVAVTARDITPLKLIQQALATSEQRLQSMYDDTPSMFFTINEESIITSANVFGAQELGYQVEELIGRDVIELYQHEDQEKLVGYINNCVLEQQRVHSWELRKIHKSGKVIWVKESARVVEKPMQKIQLFIVSEDISEKHKLSQKLTYQASHDSLTDLLNRHEFERILQALLDNSSEKDTEHILCFLDLDQFKLVNDSCGHLAGDILLKNIAEILKLKVRKSDVVARLGGDEFAILMEFCSLKQAINIADAIRQLIHDYKFIWKNTSYSIGVSIGVAIINSETDTITKIMSAADEACYTAKEAGRNRVNIYQESNQDISRRRGELAWATRIKDAIWENKFCLYAQKISAIGPNNEKPSYELLIRLHDGGRVILPDAFLPAAERYHLSTRIDEWVVLNAFRWLASPASQIDEMAHCAVNLSGYSLSDEDFLEYVIFQFERYGLPGDKICFEITETAAISNLAGATRFIDEFKKRGCLFALDDFGSGVSSFGYLKNLPVDFVKIDGCFVTDMANDAIDYAMVRSINEIAHVMNKKTIAEYVENAATLECLEQIGVDFAQGHYIGLPEIINQG